MRFGCLIILCLFLNACQLIGTVATGVRKVVVLISDDRPIQKDIEDTQINLNIRQKFVQENAQLGIDIDVLVFEGKVLLTGVLPNEQLKDKIVLIAWQTEGVQKVYDYIRIGEQPSLLQVNQEAALSAKIRTQLTLLKSVQSSNYKIQMENGTVFVMGIAQNQKELDAVETTIKSTVGVEKIVFLIRFI